MVFGNDFNLVVCEIRDDCCQVKCVCVYVRVCVCV